MSIEAFDLQIMFFPQMQFLIKKGVGGSNVVSMPKSLPQPCDERDMELMKEPPIFLSTPSEISVSTGMNNQQPSMINGFQ